MGEEDPVVSCRMAGAILCRYSEEKKQEKKADWSKHMIAGAAAGSISRTLTAPFDRLKLYLQAHGIRSSSMRLIINEMMKEGGVTSFWRGNGINILKITPETSLKFASYDAIKQRMKGDQKHEFTIYDRFIAGSLAGFITQTFIYPVEVVKTRLTLRKTGQYAGMVDAALKMYKIEGRKCFYLGYTANLLGIIPYAGVDLSVYETLKETYVSKWKDPSPHPVVVLMCGVISSFLAQTASYPLGLIRTKLQVQVITREEYAAGVRPYTMMGLSRKIFREEGILGFYRGFIPTLLKVVPSVGIGYVVYEQACHLLDVKMF